MSSSDEKYPHVDQLQMAVIDLIDDTDEDEQEQAAKKKKKTKEVIEAVTGIENATASASGFAEQQPDPKNNTATEGAEPKNINGLTSAGEEETTTTGIRRLTTSSTCSSTADAKGKSSGHPDEASPSGLADLQRVNGATPWMTGAGAYAMAPVMIGIGANNHQEADNGNGDDDSASSSSSTVNGDDEQAPLEETTLLEAVAVEDERAQIEEDVRAQIEEDVKAQIEIDVRQRVMNEAVQADVLPFQDDNNNNKNKEAEEKSANNKVFLGTLVLLAIILALGLGFGLGLSGSNDSNNQTADIFGGSEGATTGTSMEDEVPLIAAVDERSTLDIVRERGYVKCGLFAPLNWNPDTEELLDSFGTTYCKALAQVTLGDPNKFEPVWITASTRFLSLANKTIDIDIYGTTYTMARDIHEKVSHTGFTFSTPYLYVGLAFAGDPFFVDCAEALDSFHGGCRDLKICVEVNTTHLEILAEILEGGALVPNDEIMQSIADDFATGRCNVVAAEAITASLISSLYDGEWKLGSMRFSKEPISMVTREDDPEWSTLADLVVNTFFVAEAHNISKENAHLMASLSEIDTTSSVASSALRGRQGGDNNDIDLASLMVDLVANFGNQGDFYDLTVGPMLPRMGLNSLYDNDQTSGLLYAIPFGTLDQSGPGPVPNRTLDTVQQKGYLTCGVQPLRGPAFAARSSSADDDTEWSGFDIEFCRGVAASIFVGDTDKVVFVELLSTTESYLALQNGTVDMVAGARVTLQAQYKEPTTGLGFAFSTPYYYDNDSRDAFSFMTRKADVQWSEFVNWIVMATIYAEEEGITPETSIDMPVAWCFGEFLKQMFRDTIAAVGSYAEIYNSTAEQYIPRTGANRLNEGLSGPQIFPIPVI